MLSKRDIMANREIQRDIMPEFEQFIRPSFFDIIKKFPYNDNDFSKIVSFLLEECIIDYEDVENLNKDKDTIRTKVRKLLLTLRYRGDRAFKIFIEALKTNNFLGILKILKDNQRPKEPDKIQINADLEWRILTKIKQKNYPKTRAFKCGFSKLAEWGILGIIGSAGDGKTILSRMIANEFLMVNTTHILQIHVVTQPDDCKPKNLNDGKLNIMIVDDMFGKCFPNIDSLRKWESNFEMMKLLVEERQLVIIFTMRDYIYNYTKYKLQKYYPFSSGEIYIHLHKGDLTLDVNERHEMMRFHNVEKDELEQFIKYPDFGFAAIVGNTTKQSGNSSHLLFLTAELEMFWKEDMDIYTALLMVYFLDENDLRSEKSDAVVKARETIKNIYTSFNPSRALDICQELSESFVRPTEPDQCQNTYSLRETVAQAMMLHLSKKRLEISLKNSPLDLLLSMTVVEMSHCQMASKVYVPKNHYFTLSERFLSDIRLNNLKVFRHPAFLEDEFLETLLNTDKDGVLMNIKDIDLGEIDREPDKGNVFHFIAIFGNAKSLKLLLQRRSLSVIVNQTTFKGKECRQLITLSLVESEKKAHVFNRWHFPGLASIESGR